MSPSTGQRTFHTRIYLTPSTGGGGDRHKILTEMMQLMYVCTPCADKLCEAVSMHVVRQCDGRTDRQTDRWTE